MLVIALLALIGANSASAATVVNGDFETGNFEGWSVYDSSPAVEWEVGESSTLPPPLTGKHYAITQQGNPGTSILTQDIALEPGSSHQLEFTFGYFSEAPITIPSPDTLSAETLGVENQQVRVDVIKPTAAITSVSPGDILATAFASSESENTEGTESEPELAPRRFSVNLGAFAGQTVRLRFAVPVTRAPLHAIVDAVSVTSALLPVPPPPPPPPSNVFTKGKLSLNKKKGTGTLAVTVPDAGVLTLVDVNGNAKGKIKKTTATSTAGGTLKVPIKAKGMGQKTLNKKGKLPFKVTLTFTPTGGTAAAQPYSGKLVKTLKPARK